MQLSLSTLKIGILSTLLWVPFLTAAEEAPVSFEENARITQQTIQEQLDTTDDVNLLLDFDKQLSDLSPNIDNCIANDKEEIDKLTKRLDDLGESIAGEPPEIQSLRESIGTDIGNVRALAERCRELQDTNQNLRKTIEEKYRTLNNEIIRRRSINLMTTVASIPNDLPQWVSQLKSSLTINKQPDDSKTAWWAGTFFSLLGLGLGLILKNHFSKSLNNYTQPGGKEPFELNLLTSLNSFVPYMLAGLFGFLAFKNLSDLIDGWTLPTRIMLTILVGSLVLADFKWFCKANSPGDEFHVLNKNIPKKLTSRMKVVSFIAGLGFIIFGTDFLRSVPTAENSLPYQLCLLALAAALMSTLLLSREFKDLKSRSRILRFLMILACFITFPAILFGYLEAANYLVFASLMTQVSIIIFRTLTWSLDSTFNAIIHGKSKNSYKVRATLGIRAEETSTELSWLRLFLGLGFWVLFALVIITVWDYTQTIFPKIQALTNEGFNVGEDSKIIPRNIIIGIIAFAIVQAITVWLKARMERQWLRNIGMERGARDALVTLMGYIGVVIAILLGLTAAGVSFSGLAIVAGALSVGIGFGLQNIVNNFISGLILLFERPINNGDYISVGDVEGTVKRISIRSTEIETIARTNIIVPNSELIAGRVTNWVLHDSNGVIQVPIGVAYGTDTELVKALLLEVASENTDVVTRPNMPQPKVRFNGFGDNALNFSLVILIKNINNRFDALSDLNFAIAEKFKDNKIEIPFPQRDLHIKTETLLGNTDSNNKNAVTAPNKNIDSEDT